MKNYMRITVSGLLLLVILCVSLPSLASAQTISYQPQTQAEKMAYLYGRIAQLMQIKQLLDRGNTLAEAVSQSSVDYVTLDTHRAVEVEETTAVLRGEVNVYGKATAEAWFEYGQDESFLDLHTNVVNIRTVYDRPVRTTVNYLEEDERYYFRIVVMDNNDVVSYGPILSFYTDEVDEE
jgi:hypothetical protein